MPCENEDASMLDYFSEREAGAIDDLIGQMSISSAEANGVHASEVPSREDQDKAATQVDYVAVTSTRQLNDMEGLKDFNRSPASIPENSSVINKIEAVFEQMADDMLNERGELSILLETRRTRPQAVSSRDRKISFPGKTAGEAWRFSKSSLLPGLPSLTMSSRGHTFTGNNARSTPLWRGYHETVGHPLPLSHKAQSKTKPSATCTTATPPSSAAKPT